MLDYKDFWINGYQIKGILLYFYYKEHYQGQLEVVKVVIINNS